VTPPPIPLIHAQGTHAEAGRLVGEATSTVIRRAVSGPHGDLALVERYRAVTFEHVPWIVDELDGVAAGAGVEPLGVFAASIEELPAAAAAPTGCSDLVVTGARTADGHLLVAHTNDLYAEDEDDIVAIEWRVPGDPVVFTLGIGPWISVGWNEAGLSVTGNELTPNDERVGIPRLLQMRDTLTRRTLAEAVQAVLHPARASSYNWVFAHPAEGVLNVEGSATSSADDRPDADGILAHTNHYANEDMLRFESSDHVAGSCLRLERAREIGRGGPFTAGTLRAALADHENAPDSICRHGDAPKDVKTVFWCVADVTAGEITYGRGNPCDSEPQVYRFGA
jgi:isopenicillin-N N-acyltransferase-like protein